MGKKHTQAREKESDKNRARAPFPQFPEFHSKLPHKGTMKSIPLITMTSDPLTLYSLLLFIGMYLCFINL